MPHRKTDGLNSNSGLRLLAVHTSTGQEAPLIKLADISLAELQVFDAVYRFRSVIEASRALDIPQPTVSRWLAKLRAHFGDPLFVRTSSGMEPTTAADAMVGSVRDILQIYRDRLIGERAFEPSTTQRNFTIAASDFGQLTVLPALDTWAEHTAPSARFTGVPLGRDSLPEGLETGEIDVAVGGFPGLSAGIIEQTLYDDEYVCTMRQGHPLVATPTSIERFQQARHVVISARNAGHVHQQVEEKILAIVPPGNVRLMSYSFSLAPMLIGDSDHVLTVPRRVAELFKVQLNLVTMPPPIDLPRFQVKQYWHERCQHDPGHRWLRQGIAKLLASGARA